MVTKRKISLTNIRINFIIILFAISIIFPPLTYVSQHRLFVPNNVAINRLLSKILPNNLSIIHRQWIIIDIYRVFTGTKQHPALVYEETAIITLWTRVKISVLWLNVGKKSPKNKKRNINQILLVCFAVFCNVPMFFLPSSSRLPIV